MKRETVWAPLDREHEPSECESGFDALDEVLLAGARPEGCAGGTGRHRCWDCGGHFCGAVS